MKTALQRYEWSNQPSAKGYLLSAAINGMLAWLVVLACVVVAFLPISSDTALVVVGSLLPTSLVLAPIAFFHYGRYLQLENGR